MISALFQRIEVKRALNRANRILSQKTISEIVTLKSVAPVSPDQAELASTFAKDVEKSALAHDPELLCLPQAIALWSLLEKREIACRLTFGYLPSSRRNEAPLDSLPIDLRSIQEDMSNRYAHVWVEIPTAPDEWRTILGGETSDKYAVIARYPQ